MRIRAVWVIVHRWAGLTIALFLIVAGVTGSLLAFNDDLETWSAPRLHRIAPPLPGAAMLDPQMLRDIVLARHPGGMIDYLPLHFTPGRSVVLRVNRIDPRTGRITPWSSRWDELFVDPYNGRTLGYRTWGDISEGMVNLMPFLYRLHYSLALGPWGLWAFGIAALVWTLDCFVGFYLTLPVSWRRDRACAGRPTPKWWARWKPAWRVRWHGGKHRLNFDLHRAGGLWLWPLLLVFAWSGVSFNLPGAYEPVMRVFGYQRLQDGIVPPAAPRYHPRLGFRAAERLGRAIAHREAARLGFTIDPTRDSGLLHRPDAGVYAYIFSSSADMRESGGRTVAIFDSDTGRLLKTVVPQGQNGAYTVTEWITAIHMADVWGLPWRIATAALGLMVTGLSVTGVLLWMRKRAARRVSRTRHALRVRRSEGVRPGPEPR